MKFYKNRVTPVVLQAECGDCGLACIVMVANYLGVKVDLIKLREIAGSVRYGTTTKDLIECFSSLGINGKALKIEIDELKQIENPVILHWNGNHFVVLTKISRSGYEIIDPNTGRISVSPQQFSRSFTGVAITARASNGISRASTPVTFGIRDFLRQSRGYFPYITSIIAFSFVVEISSVVTPMLTQVVIDQSIPSKDIDLLILISISIFLSYILSGTVNFLRSLVMARFSESNYIFWNASLFNYLLRLRSYWYSARQVGDIVTRFSVLPSIQNTLSIDLTQAVVNSAATLIIFAIMTMYSSKLSLITIVYIFIDITIRLLRYQAYRAAIQGKILADARSQTTLIESIKNIVTIKMWGLSAKRQEEWGESISTSASFTRSSQDVHSFYTFVSSVCDGGEKATSLYIGALMVFSGELTIGMLVAFYSLKQQCHNRAASVFEFFLAARSLDIQFLRLSDITAAVPEQRSLIAGSSPFNDGMVRISALSYRYSPRDRWLFKNVNLNVEPGSFLLVRGPSGGGKSTFLSIAAGLIDNYIGNISVSETDISTYGQDTYRSSVNSVMQSDGIIYGSIIDNITLFDPEPNKLNVEMCIDDIGLKPYIESLPMGLHTILGHNDAGLSKGQIQRLLIARCIYRDKPIFILDEPTSHLDSESENSLFAYLAFSGKTIIIASHSDAALKYATHILEIGNGLHSFKVKKPIKKALSD